MLNRVVLIGRLTKDPELREIASGSVAHFRLAINRNYVNATGEKQTDYINCVIWNKGAINIHRYCSKGSLVGIEGRLQSRQYNDKDGVKRTIVEVVCDSIQFMDSPKTQQNEPPSFLEVAKQLDKMTNKFELSDNDLDLQF